MRLLFLLVGFCFGINFITLGDWGGMTLGGKIASDEKYVAEQMTSSAKEYNISFVISVGDNFYYDGVKSTKDPRFQEDFENVFTDQSLQVPWYVALGNHDYGYNVQAQLDYTHVSHRWNMPDRYFVQRIALGGGDYATFFFIDSNPCIQEYLNDDPSGWDPDTQEFHENVISQDCKTQFNWFQQQISQCTDDWKIVVGHHPLQEIDVEDFATVMNDHNVALYLAGHTHLLGQYSIDKINIDLVVSGAGCMVHADEEHAHKSSAKELPYNTIWEKKVAGFTVHQFSDTNDKLATTYLDTYGNAINSFTTNRPAKKNKN